MKKKTTKTLDLLNYLNKVVIEKKLLKKNEVLLIAMSGGQDSIVLLIIFFQLKNQWSLKLGVIFCNHLWQVEAFSTMYHILRISILLKMPSFFGLPLAQISSEQKARNWRHQVFKRISSFYSYEKIITAHTGSDRIETLFFHLSRGSGTEGIYSLNWRNRIRKQLLPSLRFFFNPQIDKLITQFIEITNDEQSYLNFLTNRILGQIEKRTTHQIELDFSCISFFPSGIQRRILRHFLEKSIKVQTKFYHIEVLRKFLHRPYLLHSAGSFQTKCIFFPKKGMLFLYSQKLVFISEWNL
nr:Ycf62 [Streptosarcina sp. YL-2023a]